MESEETEEHDKYKDMITYKMVNAFLALNVRRNKKFLGVFQNRI